MIPDDDCVDLEDGDWVVCYECDGEGYFHDCGEDTCVCLHPELDEQAPCRGCDGEGGWRWAETEGARP